MAPQVSAKTAVEAAGSTSKSSGAAAIKLIGEARKHLGTREGPNNANEFTRHVTGNPNQPWCAAFVSTVLEKANIPGVSGKGRVFSASCIELAQQFRRGGRYFENGKGTPQPGDVIFFGGKGNEHHTGIVTKVKDGKVYTIEGNSGDRVAEHVYSLNSARISGFGRVFGEGEVPPDVGIDTSGATAGSSGDVPSRRARGANSSSQATETGVDAWAYLNLTPDSVLALIRAILSGDEAALRAALEALFPYASVEDLQKLGELVKDNPQLMPALMSNPELLQQLGANPTADGVAQVLKDAPRLPTVAAQQLFDTLSRSDDAQQPGFDLLRRAFASPVASWSPPKLASAGGWGPRQT